jgi:hypothetical protein
MTPRVLCPYPATRDSHHRPPVTFRSRQSARRAAGFFMFRERPPSLICRNCPLRRGLRRNRTGVHRRAAHARDRGRAGTALVRPRTRRARGGVPSFAANREGVSTAAHNQGHCEPPERVAQSARRENASPVTSPWRSRAGSAHGSRRAAKDRPHDLRSRGRHRRRSLARRVDASNRNPLARGATGGPKPSTKRRHSSKAPAAPRSRTAPTDAQISMRRDSR